MGSMCWLRCGSFTLVLLHLHAWQQTQPLLGYIADSWVLRSGRTVTTPNIVPLAHTYWIWRVPFLGFGSGIIFAAVRGTIYNMQYNKIVLMFNAQYICLVLRRYGG